VINIIKRNFNVDAGAEFTIEANPNTVSENALSFLRNEGVNRLSLGIQSFSDDMLRILGRLHTSAQSENAFLAARKAGFCNISIDLMFGIPGQTSAEWEKTIEAATALKPEHISAYSLSLDEGSQFTLRAKTGALVLPDEDGVAEMHECVVRKLSKAGYLRYEISNFSFPGFACMHNQNYWARGEYLGLGPGAFSFLSTKRWNAIPDSAEYVRRLRAGASIAEHEEIVGADAAARETLLLGLRTSQGVDLRRFRQVYGAGLLESLDKNIEPLITAGLLLRAGGCLRFTERGFLVSEAALARLCA
jgi:oxygen-independent coproporphyrinogen-3 oxidase